MSDAEHRRDQRRFASQFNEGRDVPVQIRSGSDSRTIGGYAAKFDTMSQNLGGFKEQIRSGAYNFSASQGWPNVMARYNHDDNMLLGTTGARTLRVSTDNVGLLYDVDVPAARSDVYELTERGDVRQSSFAFIADEEEWSTDDTGYPLRTLVTVRLLDVAPVNTPAYLDTSVALRSLANIKDAAYDDVVALAGQGELRKMFVRTDSQSPAAKVRSAQAALAASLALNPNVTL